MSWTALSLDGDVAGGAEVDFHVESVVGACGVVDGVGGAVC